MSALDVILSGRKRIWIPVVVVAAVAGGLLVTRVSSQSEANRSVAIAVDPSVRPVTATIGGYEDGDAPRRVGRVVDANGEATDFVLDEVLVTAPTKRQLDAFVAHVGGRVVDAADAGEEGEPSDYLVQLDPPRAAAAAAARSIQEADPTIAGDLRVDGEDALALIALAAREAPRFGIAIAPNVLAQANGVADGTSEEVYPGKVGPNAFKWPFMNSGGAHDTGVGASWSLLEQKKKLDNRVKIMVVDGGFVPNPDFPDGRTIYEADWGDEGRLQCAGAECPWHGTQVALTAAGKLDNKWGTAGSAGPVAELVAVGAYPDMFKTLRRTEDAVKSERPKVVNFSLSWPVSLFKGIVEDAANRRLKSMKNAGAVLVASAGNDGRDVDASTRIAGKSRESILVIPCESTHVMCVGGMKHNDTFKHDGSNFGSAGGSRSVEIYGPYVTVGLKDETIGFKDGAKTRFVTGTSFASPFVAGVAGLVRAADPSLTPDETRQILLETAHVGGVHFEHLIAVEKQLRINALAAIAKVLGVTVKDPVVTITSPDAGKEYVVGQDFEFEGEATDFSGRRLPIKWKSDRDGDLHSKPTVNALFKDELSPGKHVVTASATDVRGASGSATVSFTVVDKPPDIGILSPVDGASAYPTSSIDLVGWSKDPDTNTAVSESAMRWTITRGGTTVYEASGHVRTVPEDRLEPGKHVVRLSYLPQGDGSAAGAVTSEVSLTVVAIPPGQTPPEALISKPTDGQTFYHQGGHPPPTISFVGAGHDKENGALSGQRFRWTAVSEQGTKKTLCVGSNFPGTGGGGGFTTPKSCSAFDGQLGIDKGTVASTTWAVTLEVADATGLIDKDTIAIKVKFTTG